VQPIPVEVEGSVGADVAATFAVFAPIDLPSILRGYGPLPAVEAVVDQTGGWDAAGQTREVLLADGSRMRETLTLVEAPHHFAYVVDGFTSPLRHLVREMRGAWYFEPEDDPSRTRARWRYEFHCTGRAARPPSLAIIALFWKPTMRRALAAATLQAEGLGTRPEKESRC
jgi:hypothetical protein